MSSTEFCIKWTNYQTNMVSSVGKLRTHGEFVDTELVCEDGSLSAHKVILSACSDYFKEVFKVGIQELFGSRFISQFSSQLQRTIFIVSFPSDHLKSQNCPQSSQSTKFGGKSKFIKCSQTFSLFCSKCRT